MRLLLIRHGESVDNANGLIAGSIDSPLSSHGVIQARRLGNHLASRSGSIGPITHIYSSNLQRAFHTAREVAEGQVKSTKSSPSTASSSSSSSSGPREVIVDPMPDLREKHFGSLEGTKYRTPRPEDRAAPPTDMESPEEMSRRVERFLELHLLPKLTGLLADQDAPRQCVAVVAHGIILNVLAKALLLRVSPDEYTRLTGKNPSSSRNSGSNSGSGRKSSASSAFGEFDIPWKNTAYLEAVVRMTPADPPVPPRPIHPWEIRMARPRPLMILVASVNNHPHLDGLKKTWGGIGSAKHDEKQRTVDSFFLPKR